MTNKTLWDIKNTFNTYSADFQICTLMPEDGRIRPKYVAYSDGFYKFVVSDGIKQITINLSRYNGMNSIKNSWSWRLTTI